MKIRKALHIFIDNFSNTYKLLLYRLITGVLFMGLIYVIINLGLRSIVASKELEAIGTLVKEFFTALFSGDSAYLATFQDHFLNALTKFTDLLGREIGSIVGSVIGIILLYIVSRFLNGMAVFAIGNIVNDKMAFYSKTQFSTAYFKNIGQAMLYEVIYVPITFAYDALSLLACWFLFFYLPSLLAISGFVSVLVEISLTIAAFLCLEAFKMTVISAWIPAVVTGKTVAEGFRSCFRNFKKGFSGRFSNFLIMVYLIVMCNVMFAICSVGSFLLISVPASYILLLILQLVFYYEDNNMKYFESLKTISGGEDSGEGLNAENSEE